MNDRIPPPTSPLAKHLQNVRDREASYHDVRASFGDSIELLPLDDGRVQLVQRMVSGEKSIALNYAEIVWLKKQLERIAG